MSILEVGRKVYLKPAGNNARYGNNDPQEYEIKKVGRKYFEVGKNDNERFNIKFHIHNQKQVTEYTPDWELYFSKQEILDEQEFQQLQRYIKNVFDTYSKVNLSLEQLRQIKTIIETE